MVLFGLIGQITNNLRFSIPLGDHLLCPGGFLLSRVNEAEATPRRAGRRGIAGLTMILVRGY
ncbi:MAG: hypothetical protein U0528_20265 [Anaerolineae bacterium]